MMSVGIVLILLLVGFSSADAPELAVPATALPTDAPMPTVAPMPTQTPGKKSLTRCLNCGNTGMKISQVAISGSGVSYI